MGPGIPSPWSSLVLAVTFTATLGIFSGGVGPTKRGIVSGLVT